MYNFRNFKGKYKQNNYEPEIKKKLSGKKPALSNKQTAYLNNTEQNINNRSLMPENERI